MISVENFYWILYENLLKPANLDCWFYYPFGTTRDLNQFLFQPWLPKKENHVLFHFDQEPLWDENLGKIYDIFEFAWSSKLVRILANSEKSDIKKQIYQTRKMLDWYFFYHGFASLDWFRDSQHIQDQHSIEKVFICFNHLIRDLRSYRIGLFARFIEKDLMPHGLVSFHSTVQDCEHEINSPHTRLSEKSKAQIKQTISSSVNLPQILDHEKIDGNLSAHFGHQEYKLWQRSFLHVVNETVFYDQKLYLTEKTFKPIVALRPFVLVAAPGNLEYLRSYGFRTFDQWWDERYDLIEDPDDRLDAITMIVENLCKQPFREIQEMLIDMQPILEYNKKHFFGEFRKIITDELVDNFDTCIRVWNNGRVDGRNLPRLENLEEIKNIFLR